MLSKPKETSRDDEKNAAGGKVYQDGPRQEEDTTLERYKLVVGEQWGNARRYIRDERKKSLKCNLG